MKGPKVTALVGTYRKGGIIDSLVDEVLTPVRERGGDVSKVYLVDRRIEFCTNCRSCMQQEGPMRGLCPIPDDMPEILDLVASSDAIVLASPTNFGTVTAVMKRFIERLGCLAFWPWGAPGPKGRNGGKSKTAVVVVSSAAPSFITRIFFSVTGLLKKCAGILGAGRTKVLVVGLAAREPGQRLDRARKRARRAGESLVNRCR